MFNDVIIENLNNVFSVLNLGKCWIRIPMLSEHSQAASPSTLGKKY